MPPTLPTPSGRLLFADPAAPPGGTGSKARPFASVAAAVAAAGKGASPATVLLRGGTYHERTIQLGPQHSGLTVQNYLGERAAVSGAVPLRGRWERLPPGWAPAPGVNNVFARAPRPNGDNGDVMFLGNFSALGDCEAAAAAQAAVQSFTWFAPDYPQPAYARHCYGTASGYWQPEHTQQGVISGRRTASNIFSLHLPQYEGEFLGLRLNGSREIRAKWPNGDPEVSGAEGWITAPTQWLKPLDRFPDGADKWAASEDIITNGSSWPGVHWPGPGDVGDCRSMQEDGAAGCGNFHIGSGGFCSDLSPPAGYWCSKSPPRGQAYNHTTRDTCGGKYHSCGGTQMHMAPAGVVFPRAQAYRNATGAMVQAWRGEQSWYTNGCLVDRHDRATDTLHFDQTVGCNQGGEGMVSFGNWWIENVLEELDAPREWFYNSSSHVLFYMPNATAAPPPAEQFAATRTRVLFNVSGASDLSLLGLEVRDTALTYYGVEHGMPTGGDWALERAGAVLLEGTARATVAQCLFERIDGNGIFLSNWNRNATLAHNELAWVGGSAMAAWGSTGHCLDAACKRKLPWPVGPDARGGQQPRYTRVVGNLVREVGLLQKQSSAWFQAATALSHIEGNVHFNGPRAGVNFNDWLGGGDVLEGNLLANTVRESGDHGPWNSWDRVPYISEIGMLPDPSAPPGDHRAHLPGHTPANASHPSVTPQFRQLRNNFILGNYNTLFAIDADDGSGYLQAHNNMLVYGGGGLKSFFGGQWQHHWQNVYAYVGGSGCYWTGVNVAFFDNYCVAEVPFPGRLNSSMDAEGCPRNDTYFGPTMTVRNNTILTPHAQGPICRGTAGPYPADAELLARGAAATAPYPRPAPQR